MTYLLALDPGYKQLGIALFKDESLCYGTLIEITEPDRDLAKHWIAQQDALRSFIYKYCSRPIRLGVAVELMQVDDRTGGAQAKQLLRLSGTAAAACGLANLAVKGYPPSEWNKNRSKGPNHAKILRALTDQEKDDLLVESEKITDGDGKPLFEFLRPQIKEADQLYDRAVDERTGQAEHVLDAVGIGLYHLGRLR